MVGGTQGAVGYTAAYAQNGYGITAVGQIDLYLFQTAGYIEAGGAAHKGLLARMGQTGADAHGILFGNAAFHKLSGQFLGKVDQRDGTSGICGNGNYIFILFGQCQQGIGKTFSASFHSVQFTDLHSFFNQAFNAFSNTSMRALISAIAC